MSKLNEAVELAIVSKEMERQQNEIRTLPAKMIASMEEVFVRYLGPKPKPTPTAAQVGLGEEALMNRVEEMVKTTIRSELRNHYRGAADLEQTSATAALNDTPEVRRMNQIQEMIKATIQAELSNNSAPDSVDNQKTSAAATLETPEPEPEIRQIPNYLLNQNLSVLSAWQCWHLGERQGTGTDEKSGIGSKPYVTVPWKTLKKADLDRSNQGQSGCLSNLKLLCEMLDAAAAPTIYHTKLPSSTPSLTDLATAFKSESVQAVLDDISTTSKNRKRRLDEIRWNTAARALREFHIPKRKRKTPPQIFQPGNKIIFTKLVVPSVRVKSAKREASMPANNKKEDSGDNSKKRRTDSK